MKQFLKPALAALAAFALTFAQPAMASEKHPARTANTDELVDTKFSVELKGSPNSEYVYLMVNNPSKKNLCISLLAPDGSTLDNFFTGRKKDIINTKYNFRSADDGTYTIEVSNGSEKVRKQITLERAVQSFCRLTVE